MLSPPFTLQKVIVLCVLAVLVWAYVGWQVRQEWRSYKRRGEFTPESGLRPHGHKRRRLKAGQVIGLSAVLLLAGGAIYIDQFGTPIARTRLQYLFSRVDSAMRYLMAVVVALVMLLFGMIWWKLDKDIFIAAKLSRAGKHSEVEALVRTAIALKGPSEQRLTALGVALVEQNRLAEALSQFEAAQRMARKPADAKINVATVLWKLGRREEAMRLLEEVCRESPDNYTAICNSCLLLAELGLRTEAYDRLEQAERVFERHDLRYTRHLLPLLEECRKAVPTARGFPVTMTSAESPTE